jgi:hypothetical protein
MKKKILFLVFDLNNFTGFFKTDIRNIAKYYDIRFLVYKYGFDNKNLSINQFNWFNNYKKKKIIKKIIWIDELSFNNPDIKIIGIKRKKNNTSGLLYKFYCLNNKKNIFTNNNLKNILL